MRILALNRVSLVRQQGLSLLEAMISLGVGVFLLGGVMMVFGSMRGTTSETLGLGELQENGRLAINILRRDVAHSGFWGEYQSQLNDGLLAIPANPAGDCNNGGNNPNNGSFPIESDWAFWSLWGAVATSSSVATCIDDANTNSDVLQIKRAISFPTDFDDFRSNRFYIIASSSAAAIVSGAENSDTYPLIDNSQNWMYQHLVYYIANKDFYGSTVPTLMRRRLVVNSSGAASMASEPVIDGIENIRIMYGVDVDLNGVVDSYVGAEDMLRDYWSQGSFDTSYILSARIFVLARALEEDKKYTNNNSYQLGDRTITGGGDHYRRMLFTTTASIINSVNGEWQ